MYQDTVQEDIDVKFPISLTRLVYVKDPKILNTSLFHLQ